MARAGRSEKGSSIIGRSEAIQSALLLSFGNGLANNTITKVLDLVYRMMDSS